MNNKRTFVKVELNDKEYLLKYDFNSVADLEEHFKAGIGEILSERRMGFNVLRVFYYIGLRWKTKGLTIPKTGEILGDYLAEGGTFDYLTEKMQEALEKAKIISMKEVDDESEEDEEEVDPN